MAKLFEYQGKELLRRGGIATPKGRRAASKDEVAEIARELGGPVVIKAQTWTTGRAESGGVHFADSPEEAAGAAEKVFGKNIKGFSVQEVLVEEKLDISKEFYAGVIIDDAAQRPTLIFSSRGGTGIEEIAQRFPDSVVKYPIDISTGIKGYHALDILRKLDIRGELQKKLSSFLVAFYATCRGAEARSAEINPLVITKQGQIVAADCHMVIDDYAVFRHPELGIEIAREFDRPATAMERVAYEVEAKDHRGTFYFFQMQHQLQPAEGYVGFHGAGGRLHDVHGRHNQQRIQDRQFLRYQREPFCFQSLSSRQNHTLSKEHNRLLRLRFGSGEPGAVPFSKRTGQSIPGDAPQRARRDSSGGQL